MKQSGEMRILNKQQSAPVAVIGLEHREMTLNDFLYGGDQSFKKFYSEQRNRYMNWLRSEFRIPYESGKDIFQNAMVITYDNLVNGKVDNLETSATTYVFGVCRNLVREYQRQNVRINSISDEMIWNHTSDDTDLKDKEKLEENVRALQTLLKKLGDRCQELLKLFYYKQLSYERICELMNYQNQNSAKTNKYKCMERLRALWEEFVRTKSAKS